MDLYYMIHTSSKNNVSTRWGIKYQPSIIDFYLNSDEKYEWFRGEIASSFELKHTRAIHSQVSIYSNTVPSNIL
jgi:hypothetical protein